MEELQVIETTSGRQFKPWATKDDVQDPASVTAIASEIASGKQAIASAINAKGGEASATESFTELAQDIQNTPTSGVLSSGIVQSEPFSFLDYVCKKGAYPFPEINDDSVTVIDRGSGFYGRTNLLKVKMTALRAISGSGVFQGCSALQEVDMPNLTTISGGSVFQGCSALQEVDMPNLTTISGGSVFADCLSLQRIEFPNLQTWTNASLCFSGCSSLEEFIAPILRYYSQGYYGPFHYSNNLKNIVVGTLTNQCFTFTENAQANLRNITIGQDTNINIDFSRWSATNVIAEGQSGIDELNSNLYNNLLTKLYDHSQDGQTRTLRIGWLANVTAENIAYANAKGWTLTT